MGYSHSQLRAMGLGHLIDTSVGEDGKKRKSKFGNVRTEEDGLKFDSKKEHKRYTQLKLMERVGLVKDLQHHKVFEISPAVKFPSKKTISIARTYEADFVYIDTKTGQTIVEDVKSEATKKDAFYLLKKHLMMVVHGIEIQEV